MSAQGEPHGPPDPLARAEGLADLHIARTDLQAIVQGAFMEELLGLPEITAELDRIDRLIDELAALPEGEISDEGITVERDGAVAQLATDLELAWPWFISQLQIGLWQRQKLVEAERWRAANSGQQPATPVPGWPPKWTADRRILAVGGAPWALVDMELAPRFAMKRGDSLDALKRRWQVISSSVEAAFRMSMFSSVFEESPPGGAPRDDAAAYERYARWAARHLAGGESYRNIADRDLRTSMGADTDHDTVSAVSPRERWREVKRGVRKALDVLDSI